MLYADASRGRPFSKDPAVIRFQDRYLLYYSLPPYRDGRTPDGWSMGIAESDGLEHWHRLGDILPEQLCERNGICAPGAIVLDGRVHLFYQTYGNGPRDAICHAVSDDGLHFERDPSNPVFHPSGDWTCGRAIDADVIAHRDQLLLYWATRDPTMTVQMLGLASAPLVSDFSRETWTQRCAAPILKPELPWEQKCIEAPALCEHGDMLWMFYGGAYNNSPQQIGCACSQDGLAWKRLSDQPFLPNGAPGTWNACESGHPYAFTDDDGQTHLFFQGNNDMGQTWNLSRVRIGWEEGEPRIVDE
ncbi:MAG: family 43 glycosylhydrolase [Anaerolineae bacterium]|nr:family 43 glycosylhydrolase [Anaerolineae bacterium]